jgi:trehalose utilization protein
MDQEDSATPLLAATDVLTRWGHAAHAELEEAVVERVQRRVLDGMGLTSSTRPPLERSSVG